MFVVIVATLTGPKDAYDQQKSRSRGAAHTGSRILVRSFDLRLIGGILRQQFLIREAHDPFLRGEPRQYVALPPTELQRMLLADAAYVRDLLPVAFHLFFPRSPSRGGVHRKDVLVELLQILVVQCVSHVLAPCSRSEWWGGAGFQPYRAPGAKGRSCPPLRYKTLAFVNGIVCGPIRTGAGTTTGAGASGLFDGEI